MSGAPVPGAYPAVHHFGIVVKQSFDDPAALAAALAGCDVVTPLHDGQRSRRGTYRTLRVSVRDDSRKRLEAVDASLRAVAGVMMLL